MAEVEASQVEALMRAMGGDAEMVGPRLIRGCRCFAAWAGGEIVSFGWLSETSEWIGEVGLEVHLDPGEAYIWNCVTLPDHRRRGLFRTIVRKLAETARAEGMARVWIASLEGSPARAVVGLGFEPVLHLEPEPALPEGRLKLAPADGANRALHAAALRVLAASGEEWLQPGPPRRH